MRYFTHFSPLFLVISMGMISNGNPDTPHRPVDPNDAPSIPYHVILTYGGTLEAIHAAVDAENKGDKTYVSLATVTKIESKRENPVRGTKTFTMSLSGQIFGTAPRPAPTKVQIPDPPIGSFSGDAEFLCDMECQTGDVFLCVSSKGDERYFLAESHNIEDLKLAFGQFKSVPEDAAEKANFISQVIASKKPTFLKRLAVELAFRDTALGYAIVESNLEKFDEGLARHSLECLLGRMKARNALYSEFADHKPIGAALIAQVKSDSGRETVLWAFLDYRVNTKQGSVSQFALLATAIEQWGSTATPRVQLLIQAAKASSIPNLSELKDRSIELIKQEQKRTSQSVPTK